MSEWNHKLQALDDENDSLRDQVQILKEREQRVLSAISWFKWVVGISIPLFGIGVGWLISVERNLATMRTDIQWLKTQKAVASGQPVAQANGGGHGRP